MDNTKHSHTGIEVLRILAMLMIVSLHYLGKGGILETTQLSTNYLLGSLIDSFCYVCVNCYVLISGYFLVKSSDFKIEKACKLWLQIFFYSVGIFFLLSCFNIVPFSLKNMLKSFLPIKVATYWFATAYMGLYLLFPYLNKLIITLSKKDYQKLILILVGVFSVYSFGNDTFHADKGYSPIWFIVLYFIGGYIRIFNPFDENKKILLGYIFLSLFLFITRIVIYNIGSYLGLADKHEELFYAYNSPIVLLASVALFLFFSNTVVSSLWLIRLINFFAPLTFGVYLIHEHFLIRDLLWKNWLNVPAFHNSNYFFLHYIISVVIVFVICAIIEKGRQKIFSVGESIYQRISNKK